MQDEDKSVIVQPTQNGTERNAPSCINSITQDMKY